MCYFMLDVMSILTIKTKMLECEMMADSFNDESVPIRPDQNVCNFYKFFHENLGLSLGDCVSRLGRLSPFINLRNVRVAHQNTSTCSNREPSTRLQSKSIASECVSQGISASYIKSITGSLARVHNQFRFYIARERPCHRNWTRIECEWRASHRTNFPFFAVCSPNSSSSSSSS